MMTFKKLIKAIAEEFEIPKEKVEAINDSVTKLIDGRTAPLQEQIREFEEKNNEQTFTAFGKLTDKDAKMFKALIKANRGEDESFEDAMNRVAKEFNIEPQVDEGETKVPKTDETPAPTKSSSKKEDNPPKGEDNDDDEDNNDEIIM